MKKLVLLFLLVITSSLLFAETVFWIGQDPIGKEWSNKELIAFTDLYTKGSTVSVTSEYGTIYAQVAGKLPETVEGRDLALTSTGLMELGLWGQGHTVVSVKLRSGAMLEKDETAEATGSGWYRLLLDPMTSTKAYEAYRTLSRKGLKPRAMVSDGLVVVYIPDVVAYEKEEVVAAVKAAGYRVAKETEQHNPYL